MRGATPAGRGIHVAIYSDSTTWGGAEVAASALVRALHDDLVVTVVGHDADVVARLSAGRPSAGRAVVPPVAHKADVHGLHALFTTVRHLGLDVFHANLTWPGACRFGLAAALVTPGVRTVAVEQLPLPLTSGFSRWWKRAMSRRLDAHVAVGDRAARMVERDVGLPAGSIRTIHNAVDPATVTRRAQTPRGDGPLVVGALGRLVPQKGYDVLLRAVAALGSADIRVRVVGEGPERGTLERLAESAGVADRVTFEGWRDDAPAVLASFDVLVLPSRDEGFPLSIVEAMLAGVPVIATDVGSVGEAITDGETGLLVPPDDPTALATALSRLAADRSLSCVLAERARARASAEFTAATMARSFEALYAEITAR